MIAFKRSGLPLGKVCWKTRKIGMHHLLAAVMRSTICSGVNG